MDKLDLFQELKATDYSTPRKPVLLDIKPAVYLSLDGCGSPREESFQEAIGALYAMAYTLKFASKAEGRDFKVAPLEGQWWVDDPRGFDATPMQDWQWRLLIRIPDFINSTQLKSAAAGLTEKGKSPLVQKVKRATIKEGRCVQMLHVGPYDREQPTIQVMLSHASCQGLRPAGHHHEIYLSDPRRVAPEKLRTILRYPVRTQARTA
jgi:hypothetical protein